MHIISTKKNFKKKSYLNQSSKGIEILNYMELYDSPVNLKKHLTYKQKLDKLIQKHPDNDFYVSLLKFKTLSQKQKNIINLDFNLNYLND